MKKSAVLVGCLLLGLTACSSSADRSQSGQVAARVGDRDITVGELEERWAKSDPAEHAETMQKLYDARRKALDEIIAETLFAEAASSSGMSREGWEEAELSKRAKPVTDSDVESFYKANIAEMEGRSLEDMAPLINRFLGEQYRASARDELIADLRKKGPSVNLMLEVPRREIAVAETDPSQGTASAPVTIVEFSDFQCPYCQRASPTLRRIKETYGDKVRLVWKDFPLTQIHPEAFRAAEAAHCAGEQGKFWVFHDRLFADQSALGLDALKRHATQISLDVAKFDQCLASSKYADRVRNGVAEGTALGVSSTPTVYINGRMLAGAYPYETFAGIIEEELARANR
jgi:protein-disulfide isomerase